LLIPPGWLTSCHPHCPPIALSTPAGTWQANSGTPTQGKCTINSGSGTPKPYSTGYQCICADKKQKTEWRADAACADGVEAAASGPAVCRFQKYNSPSGPWIMGWLQGTSTNSICHTPGAPFGPRSKVISSSRTIGNTQNNLQVLCRGEMPERSCG